MANHRLDAPLPQNSAHTLGTIDVNGQDSHKIIRQKFRTGSSQIQVYPFFGFSNSGHRSKRASAPAAITRTDDGTAFDGYVRLLCGAKTYATKESQTSAR